MNIKLTFAIPTYNGALQIGQTIESILCQITEETRELIEIVISDNGSTDQTNSIIDNYRNNSLIPIKYHRHGYNLGYDKNVDHLFKLSNGEYVWTIADDDTLRPGAIERILHALKNSVDLNLILVNFIAYDSTMSKVNDFVELSDDLICNDAFDFLKKSESKYSLLSALIFKKNAWLSIDRVPGFNTNFIHVYSTFKIIKSGKSLIISEPLINYRQGSTNFGVSGDSMLKVGLASCQVVLSMRQMGYDEKVINWILGKSKRYIYGLVKAAKIAGVNDSVFHAKALISIYPTPKVIFKLVPLLLMPNKIFYFYHTLKIAVYNFVKK